VLDHKADTAFRISCERPDIRLNKLDQVSHQHFKDFAAFKSSPAPCDVQRQFCPIFDYSSYLNTPFNIRSVVDRRRPSQSGDDGQQMVSGRLMALSANRRNSLFLQRCAVPSFRALFTFPTDVTQVIISHARLFYYFCGMLYLALLGDGRLAMHLPVANYAAGFCVVREHLSKEWSCKMTRFVALPIELQCDGRAIILAGPTVIRSYSSS
jgi:hypothetical protein